MLKGTRHRANFQKIPFASTLISQLPLNFSSFPIQLASVLEIDAGLVRDAVSLYCRLGFAKRKNSEMDPNDLHPSWYDHLQGTTVAAPAAQVGDRRRARALSGGSSDEDDSLLR